MLSINLNHQQQHKLIALVKQVLQHGVTYGELLSLPTPKDSALCQLAATFVTLKLDGQLTGCIGCCRPRRPLWQDVCEHAYASAFNDQRFMALKASDLERLSFDIAILSPLKKIRNQGESMLYTELTPEIDGLLMEYHQQGAVFLPSVWQLLPKAETFVAELKRKAGWSSNYWHDDIELSKFSTQVISAQQPF